MKLKLLVQFGYGQFKKEMDWFQQIKDFPKIIKHNGKNWEWVAYDSDLHGYVDYILHFAELGPNSPHYGAVAPTLNELLGGTVEKSCECGARYDRHFPNNHMFLCPLWKSKEKDKPKSE